MPTRSKVGTPSPALRWLRLLWQDGDGNVRIGFTGTQIGMTDEQYDLVDSMVKAIKGVTPALLIAHHGDCIGADEGFHEICAWHGVSTEAHPAALITKRAFKQADIVHPVQEPLARNHVIVDTTSLLIVAPKSVREVRRSGTWATVRYARKQGKVLWFAMPDGSTMVEPKEWEEARSR